MSLFHFAIVGMFILVIMGIISNTNERSFTQIENQIFLMNCPYPINGGTATNINIDGLTANYTLVRDASNSTNYHLTVFNCEVTDPDIPTYSANIIVYETANNWFDVGTSYLAYIMNYIFSFTKQIQGALTLFSFILTPANFEILGFTLNDLSGVAVAIVVILYLFSYAMIVAWLYVTFNPFKGGSG